jgi:ABC-type glycerol-3-phosphate transport system substrate-binding protein
MAGLSRRHLLQGAAVAGGMLAVSSRSVRAQGKPDKLVYIGENQGGWKRVLMEEVGPAFEKATGIKVQFTMMPVDAWPGDRSARYRPRLTSQEPPEPPTHLEAGRLVIRTGPPNSLQAPPLSIS